MEGQSITIILLMDYSIKEHLMVKEDRLINKWKILKNLKNFKILGALRLIDYKMNIFFLSYNLILFLELF